MDLQAEIKWISKELQEVRDPDFIKRIKSIIKKRKNRASIEEYNKEIDEAINDIEAGRVHSHEEVKAMISQWARQ